MTGKIGPYLIEKKLGLGGMAEVFLAKKQVGSAYKRVVVKRMLPDLSEDPKFVEMFEREAGILAQLNHANVVQIFDLGTTDDGKLYIAMEYLDGISVHDLFVRAWKAHKAPPLELALRIIAEAARGLDYVHRQTGSAGEQLGLVHRDVAPDNLFFVKDGTIKLLDFGVARGATMKMLTRQGEVKGKVPFMSPEALESGQLDGRSDLWSLGVTAYWLLTGKRPFRGDNDLAMIRAILRTEPPPLITANPEAPPWLSDLVHRLMLKNPLERIRSGSEVESIIVKNAGSTLDRAHDVDFVHAVLAVKKADLDDVTSSMPASRRAPSGVFKRVPVTGESTHRAAKPVPRAVSALEAHEPEDVSDDVVEGEADDDAAHLHAPHLDAATEPDNAVRPKMTPKPPASPLPRAVGVEIGEDLDDPSGDTQRLTESQLGLRAPSTASASRERKRK